MQKLGGAEVISQVPSQSKPAPTSLCGNINPSNWLNKRRANYRQPNTLMTPMIASILNLMGPDMMVILLIVLLLFGAKKLPELARGMGRAVKEFSAARDEIERGLGQSSGGGVAQPSLLDAKSELPPPLQS
jgi:sec-independent protein translocase protein TatA